VDGYAFLHLISFLLHYNFFPFNRLEDQSAHGVVISEVPGTDSRKLENAYNLLESDDDIQNSAIGGNRNFASTKEMYSAVPTEHAKVIFLPLSALKDFPKKEKFKNFFHVVTVSQNMTQFVTEDLAGMMCDGALLIVESKLYLLELRKENLLDFGKNLNCTAEACHCVPAREFNPLKDPVAMFTMKRPDCQIFEHQEN
jgi:dynein assembly factor 3